MFHVDVSTEDVSLMLALSNLIFFLIKDDGSSSIRNACDCTFVFGCSSALQLIFLAHEKSITVLNKNTLSYHWI